MMDSGSSISLVIENLVKDFPYDQTNSLSAARDPIPVVGNVTASIQVGISQYTIP